MAIIFYDEEYAKNLPDSYQKDSDSNNFKILEIERCVIKQHLEDIYKIYDILDLDNAYGKTLDYYGERVGLSRGTATDPEYITLIKAKLVRNLGNGTYPSVTACLAITFNCDYEDVYITETDEPCRVNMINLPYDIIESSGMADSDIYTLVKSLLPICIRLDDISFDGTFEFSGSESEYDETAGFSDNEQTIGGYLGYIYTG
ncbi:MAG: hypothetical protein LUD81_04805 [Clostridiales bacterium]|nr:hypothetical protein [Clostridiales bacterium]